MELHGIGGSEERPATQKQTADNCSGRTRQKKSWHFYECGSTEERAAEDEFQSKECSGNRRLVNSSDGGSRTKGYESGQRQRPQIPTLTERRNDRRGELDHRPLTADSGSTGNRKSGGDGGPKRREKRNAACLITDGFDVLGEGVAISGELLSGLYDQCRQQGANHRRDCSPPQGQAPSSIGKEARVAGD